MVHLGRQRVWENYICIPHVVTEPSRSTEVLHVSSSQQAKRKINIIKTMCWLSNSAKKVVTHQTKKRKHFGLSWTTVVHNQLNKLYCRTHVKLWSFFIWCIYTCSYFICHILYSYLNGITKDFLHVFPSDYVYLSYRKSINKHPSPVSLIPTFPPIFLKMIDCVH